MRDDPVREQGELEAEREGVSNRGGFAAGDSCECGAGEIRSPIDERAPREQREQH